MAGTSFLQKKQYLIITIIRNEMKQLTKQQAIDFFNSGIWKDLVCVDWSRFREQNVIFAKDQPQYNPLPALVDGDNTVSCWELSDEEIKQLNETKMIWLLMKNFKQPLQPVFMTINKYEIIEES